MATVKGTRGSKYARRGIDDDEPPDCLETAGNLMIKELVQKQTNTKITLRQQLLEGKEFVKGIGCVSLNEISAGATTLKDFEKTWQQAEINEEKARTHSQFLSAVSDKSTALGNWDSKPHSANGPKVAPQKKESLNFEESVGRQQWELAMTEKPGSVVTRLYQFATQNMQKKLKMDERPPEHPIHHLAKAAEQLSDTADPQRLAKTLRRKRRQIVEAQADPPWVHHNVPDGQDTLWDTIEQPLQNPKPKLRSNATCKKQSLYTIRNGEIVEINSSHAAKTICSSSNDLHKTIGKAFVAVQNDTKVSLTSNISRFSEEDIRKLPRFQNYDRGKVTKTLFIKNLPRNITETELSDIFGQFQEPTGETIVYRLMTGKMKGQAFVTFSSREKATAALEALNGTILKLKPIIIQYGHQD